MTSSRKMRDARWLMFDLDGCLVDSTVAIGNSLNHVLRTLGVPQRRHEEFRRFIGPPLPEALAVLLSEAGLPDGPLDEAVTLYRQRYAQHSLAETQLVDGMRPVLAALSTSHDLMVVTTKPQVFARPIVEHLGLSGYFHAVHGPALDATDEVKAVTLQRALDQADASAGRDRAVMIGDRHHDVDAGRHHALRTVGVTWGAGNRAELVAAGADVIVETPAALLDLFAP